MSFRLRKKASPWDLNHSHRIPTYFEVVEAVYDGEYFHVECKNQHTRNALCGKRYGYEEVTDSVIEPEPEASDSGPDANDFSVSSLESKLDDGDFDSQLLQLLASEESGKNRKTAIQAIQDRIDFIGE